MPAPGMTAGNTLCRQPAAFEYPVFFDRFEGILRTGGGKPAFGTKNGRYNDLVKPDQDHERKAKYAANDFHQYVV